MELKDKHFQNINPRFQRKLQQGQHIFVSSDASQ